MAVFRDVDMEVSKKQVTAAVTLGALLVFVIGSMLGKAIFLVPSFGKQKEHSSGKKEQTIDKKDG